MDEPKTKTYWTLEDVRGLLSQAADSPLPAQYVYNLCRARGALASAQVGRGLFDPARTRKVARRILARRLLRALGWNSPRLPGDEYMERCSQCDGIAVRLGDKWLCENNHGGSDHEA